MTKDDKQKREFPVDETRKLTPQEIEAQALAESAADQGDFDARDQTIPRLKILQDLSKEIKKGQAEFIEGAEVGDVCLGATREVFPGRQGVTIIPCYYRREYPVFIPRKKGGGFVRIGTEAEHAALDPNEDGERIDAHGHEIVETGSWYCLLLKPEGTFMPVVIGMSKAAFKASRQLSTFIDTFREPSPNGPLKMATYWRAFTLTTAQAQNRSSQLYQTWVPTPSTRTLDLPLGPELLAAAKTFRELVRGGSVKVETGAEA